MKSNSVKLVKVPKGQMKAAGTLKKAKTGDPILDFEFLDSQDSNVHVNGVDKQKQKVDISDVATLTVVSSDPSIVTVDPPVGMSFLMHGVAPGAGTVDVTATWNDASTGPFSFSLPVTCKAGPAGGIEVIPGDPVDRP